MEDPDHRHHVPSVGRENPLPISRIEIAATLSRLKPRKAAGFDEYGSADLRRLDGSLDKCHLEPLQ
ncbi:hypothetical protein J6590_004085 [Homalodisca vitripennis]|nr:hypothetical protein J6590_004085 [Homalodisca vitripennis]